jgi:TonB family protein
VNKKLFTALLFLAILSLTVFAQDAVTRSEDVIRSTAIKIGDPGYPPLAKIAKQEGKVVVEIVISETGGVISASAQSGPPLLQAAAVRAATASIFRHTLLSGVPVKVKGILTFDFKLANSNSEASVKQEKPNTDDYPQLLERVKKMDKTVDFTQFRLAYAETSDYDPYGPSRNLLTSMYAAFNGYKYQQAIDLAEKILERNYVSYDAHTVADNAYLALGNREKSDYHRGIAAGLLDSVRKSGDGTSVETAMVVISTREEYLVLQAKGLDPTAQALLHQGGHSYDKLSAVDPKTGEKSEFYFQIDRVFGHWDKIFNKKQ